MTGWQANRENSPHRRGWAFTLIPTLMAMAFGYFAAGRLGLFFPGRGEATRRFAVMNTEASIIIPADSGSDKPAGELADLAEQAMRRVDFLMSPAGGGSDVKRLNDAPAGVWIEVAPETWTVVMEALRWHRISDGAFDPTIGPVKRLFSFERQEAGRWPDPAELAEAKRRVGAEKLRFEREGMRLSWAENGMRLDLGAVAKGYGVDRAIAVLAANGVENALVEIGGEIRTLGRKTGSPERPWRAGIQNPRGEGVIPLADIGGKALATSGDSSQYFTLRGKRYAHIIDPRRGEPLEEGVLGVSVIHPDSCMAADALATTMTVLGREEGRRFLEEHALGLFSRGVSIVMFTLDGAGETTQTSFTLDGSGKVGETESVPLFSAFDRSGDGHDGAGSDD